MDEIEEEVLTFTLQRGSRPAYVVTIPAASVKASDDYAISIGRANTEHLMMRMMLDNLLVQTILPRIQHPPEIQAQLDALQAEMSAKRKQFEEARVAPYLPALSIGGVRATLNQVGEIEAKRRAKEESERLKTKEPKPEPEPEPQP